MFLQGMRFWSGLTLAKLDLNREKTEGSKLSLGIINSNGFVISSNWFISLGLLDTGVFLDSSTLLTVSSFFLMELIYVSNMSSLFLMEVIDA